MRARTRKKREKAEDRPTCRICLCEGTTTATTDGSERLISPCLCRGSMQYVHLSCLQSWRASATRNESLIRCEQCQYEYRIERTALALFLMSNQGATCLASTSVLLAVHLCGAAMHLMTTREWKMAIYGFCQFADNETAQYLTQTIHGQILTLGGVTLGILSLLYHYAELFYTSYNEYQTLGVLHLKKFKGSIIIALWVYGEVVHRQAIRGLPAIMWLVALYFFHKGAVKRARDVAQWLGETILEPPTIDSLQRKKNE